MYGVLVINFQQACALVPCMYIRIIITLNHLILELLSLLFVANIHHLILAFGNIIPYSHRGETPLLYTVLPEKTAAVGGAMMGSDHVYEISGVSSAN